MLWSAAAMPPLSVRKKKRRHGRRTPEAALQSLLLVISDSLNRAANRGADQSALQRFVVIDSCAGNGADNHAARLTVVMTMSMMRPRKCASSRQHQRHAEDGCLNLFASHGCNLRHLETARSVPVKLSFK